MAGRVCPKSAHSGCGNYLSALSLSKLSRDGRENPSHRGSRRAMGGRKSARGTRGAGKTPHAEAVRLGLGVRLNVPPAAVARARGRAGCQLLTGTPRTDGIGGRGKSPRAASGRRRLHDPPRDRGRRCRRAQNACERSASDLPAPRRFPRATSRRKGLPLVRHRLRSRLSTAACVQRLLRGAETREGTRVVASKRKDQAELPAKAQTPETGTRSARSSPGLACTMALLRAQRTHLASNRNVATPQNLE